MPDLPVNDVNRSGITPVYAGSPTDDAANLVTTESYDFVNDSNVVIHIRNQTTAGLVSIETPRDLDGLSVADRVVDILADTEVFIGPFPVDVYNNTERKVALTFTTPNTMELLAIRH